MDSLGILFYFPKNILNVSFCNLCKGILADNNAKIRNKTALKHNFLDGSVINH